MNDSAQVAKKVLTIRNPVRFAGALVLLCLTLVMIMDLCRASADLAQPQGPDGNQPVVGFGDDNLMAIAPPPFSKGIFPCSDCHDGKDVNTQRRVVEEHDDIVLEHDTENRWCLDCHDTVNRDKLHLADGRLLDFTQSYRLCGQCHGPELRDWKAGVHGKRTGMWSGKKQYLLCVNCHSPHSPRFKAIKPLPAPVRPEALR